jgi:hypothetical protein
VPAPSGRGVLGKARARANRAFAETIAIEANGHGNGHEVSSGNGHAAVAAGDGEHAAVGAPDTGAGPAQVPPGEASDPDEAQ